MAHKRTSEVLEVLMRLSASAGTKFAGSTCVMRLDKQPCMLAHFGSKDQGVLACTIKLTAAVE